MVSSSLLTFCVGVVCSISETHVNYHEVAASSSVQVLAKELQAERFRLQSFSEWLRLETDANIWNFLSGLDYNINPTLKAIEQKVNIAKAEGKVAEQCYTVALQNITQEAEQQLPAVVACIEIVANFTDVTLVDVADRLDDMKSVEEQLKSILPKCEGSDHKTDCIRAELETVTSSILNLDSYSRSTVENGDTNYFRRLNKAMACVLPVSAELREQLKRILDESNLCIRSAKTTL